jgi:hypothetical protein
MAMEYSFHSSTTKTDNLEQILTNLRFGTERTRQMRHNPPQVDWLSVSKSPLMGLVTN